MSSLPPITVVLRSDTRKKLLEPTDQIAEKEGTSDGRHMHKRKMLCDKSTGRMSRSKKIKTRESAHAAKDQGVLVSDIIWEILLRASIETLLTCRRVCKTWNDMTKSPTFVDAQMKISSKQPPRFICRDQDFAESLDTAGLYLCDLEQNKSRKLPLERFVFRNKVISFSHNGLLCLAPTHFLTNNDPVVICNPITKEYIELPQTDDVNNYRGLALVGFCFVPALQKHVAVQLSSIYTEDRKLVTRCYIWTSGQSSWRLLTCCPTLLRCYFKRTTVYWNNAFHWIFGEEFISKNSILSFDTVHEKFQIIPCPEDTGTWQEELSLLVLNGRLNLMKRLGNITKLWEMKGDKAGDFSLVHHETYAIDGPRIFSLRSRLNDNKLLMTAMHRHALCTDFFVVSNETRQVEFVPINGLPQIFTTEAYHPSLASVRSMGLFR